MKKMFVELDTGFAFINTALKPIIRYIKINGDIAIDNYKLSYDQDEITYYENTAIFFYKPYHYLILSKLFGKIYFFLDIIVVNSITMYILIV